MATMKCARHSNKAFKFKQRLHFKRYTFLRTRGFSIVIRHSLPTKASFQKVYFFLGTPVELDKSKYKKVGVYVLPIRIV